MSGGLTFSGSLPGTPTPPPAPVVEDGLTFSGFLPAADIPVDPSGDSWRGETGPVGPAGPAGVAGPAGATAAVEDGAALISWSSAAGASVANGAYVLVLSWPWATGGITGLVGATANGSFEAAVSVNGVAVPGAAVLVNSAVPVAAVAGANAVPPGATVIVLISATAVGVDGGFDADFLTSDFAVGVSALPTDATVQVNYVHSPV